MGVELANDLWETCVARFRMRSAMVRIGAAALILALSVGQPGVAALAAELVAPSGDFGGTVFTDLNVNGVQEPEETGLAGITITISGGAPFGQFEQITDARGRFSFRDIPTGNYFVVYRTTGWAVYGLSGQGRDSIDIDESPTYADVRLPAVRPLNEQLRVGFFFDRDTYQAGETTRPTVVLTNLGSNTLTGITVECSPVAGKPGLLGREGWGPLAGGGPGMSLPAGATRVVSVSEPVPEVSPRFGYVRAFCTFRAAGFPRGPEVYFEATAQVPGVGASGRGRIFQDHDGNGRIDDGEALAGVTVVVADPDTGVVVARPVTDASGGFAVDDVPAAVYDVRVAGLWKPRFDRSWFQFPIVAGDSATESHFAVVPGTERENNRPNLKVSAALDKQTYKSGDDVRVRVTVTNLGEVAAEGVRVSPSTDLVYEPALWGEFYPPWGPGGRIEAGATRVFEIVGSIKHPSVGVVTFAVSFNASNGEVNLGNNVYATFALVIATRGTFAGVLYGDRNNNGVMDPGEALGRVQIQLRNMALPRELEQTTDAQGRFAFRDIPTGRYRASYNVLGGWLFSEGDVIVDELEHPEVEVRVARPLSEFLTVSLKFTRDTYAVGEMAHLTLTLTNRGQSALTRIIAMCAGEENAIGNTPPGWGALAYDGPGITLGAGESRTVNVWSIVPAKALMVGMVDVSCQFGHSSDIPGNPIATDKAKVPGGFGGGFGVLVYDRNSDNNYDGDGIPNTKIVLIDEFTGVAVARVTTDAAGHFAFTDVPAGPYEFRVIGPWKRRDGWLFTVLAGRNWNFGEIHVVPGPQQPDPDAQPQAGPPQPQGGVAPGGFGRLASTGATVIGLSIGGVAAVAVGLGLLLVRRRTGRRA